MHVKQKLEGERKRTEAFIHVRLASRGHCRSAVFEGMSQQRKGDRGDADRKTIAFMIEPMKEKDQQRNVQGIHENICSRTFLIIKRF